jgi:hypothetical protein
VTTTDEPCPDLAVVLAKADEAIIEAAMAWVENISSPPNWWADTPDHVLIEAVFTAYPALRAPMEAKWAETNQRVQRSWSDAAERLAASDG